MGESASNAQRDQVGWKRVRTTLAIIAANKKARGLSIVSRCSVLNASLTLGRPLEKRRTGMHVDWCTLDQRLVTLIRILLGRVTEESLSKA